MENYYRDTLPLRIKDMRAHKMRCQAMVDEGNEFAVAGLLSAGRELEALLAKAAEADIPAELITVGSIPTHFKLREEVSRLQAQLLAAEATVEDARTLRLAATSRRERAEEELRSWKVAAAAAAVLAVLSWI